MFLLSRFGSSIQRYQIFWYLSILILVQFLCLFRTRFFPFSGADEVTKLLHSWFVICAWQWNAGNKNCNFIKHGNSKYLYHSPYIRIIQTIITDGKRGKQINHPKTTFTIDTDRLKSLKEKKENKKLSQARRRMQSKTPKCKIPNEKHTVKTYSANINRC